jgi:hypothetical protein
MIFLLSVMLKLGMASGFCRSTGPLLTTFGRFPIQKPVGPGPGRFCNRDPTLSATSVDINQAGNRLIGYSGVLAIRPVILSPDPHDEILFGVCRTGAPQTVSLRAFRYSIYNW